MLYLDLQSINKRATLEQMCIYKHAFLLHKLVNLEILYVDFIYANFQQTFNNRLDTFHFLYVIDKK